MVSSSRLKLTLNPPAAVRSYLVLVHSVKYLMVQWIICCWFSLMQRPGVIWWFSAVKSRMWNRAARTNWFELFFMIEKSWWHCKLLKQDFQDFWWLPAGFLYNVSDAIRQLSWIFHFKNTHWKLSAPFSKVNLWLLYSYTPAHFPFFNGANLH